MARNNRDWYHLLDLCALVDTLIGDGDGLYHPGVVNVRLLLGLKGTMSEVELHLIRSRLVGGLWEAARGGALRTHLPVGFMYDPDGKVVITPDEAIRETVALVFAKFAELGSARQVTAYFVEERLPLPHQDLREGTVTWRTAAFSLIHHMLTNPVYAGVYAYGRSRIERRMDERGLEARGDGVHAEFDQLALERAFLSCVEVGPKWPRSRAHRATSRMR